ncbi:hypothetical protein HP499_20175 [Paenarthrobacter sp. CM16]|uniref:hypothetical protein n=1 Tax=Paenarthrobacter sp. CM16 TaxID=2738447 RepID=UPI0015534103|nr:hypothetical protein [Paenarthrobacter sp. CM16]NQD90109.1 hypothetical protein [Paenarthrobacter sp. CM16]
MAGVPEHQSGSDPAREPEYEVIGGVIDDQPSGLAAPKPPPDPSGGSGVLRVAAGEAWVNTRKSLSSWWFWMACMLGIAFAWGSAAGLVAWAESNSWFLAGAAGSTHMIMAAVLALAAAVLGAGWGFRHPEGRIPVLVLSGVIRGAALAVMAGASLLLVGLYDGGPAALAGVAVVVVVLEAALFGLVGAGARRCSTKVAPAAVLATVLVAFLCVGNVVLTILILPATAGSDRMSVPVNVERDDSGRTISYLCVGELGPVNVEHTDRIAWLATSNPVFILGSLGVDAASPNNELGWLFLGLQAAVDGPSREVPCLGGISRDGLAPPAPVALTGLAVQGVVAALVLAAGHRLQSRRVRVSSGGPVGARTRK